MRYLSRFVLKVGSLDPSGLRFVAESRGKGLLLLDSTLGIMTVMCSLVILIVRFELLCVACAYGWAILSMKCGFWTVIVPLNRKLTVVFLSGTSSGSLTGSLWLERSFIARQESLMVIRKILLRRGTHKGSHGGRGRGEGRVQPEMQTVAQATNPVAPVIHVDLTSMEQRFKDLIMKTRAP
ncbi:gag protease polyprotein [Cucumis melo var. makuwa]|uniref:Gag protease polyprotein n=1 Tax=Cucumis melo var. makuwa TaxID=1194695 RepID=A0A5D3C1M4_CUCMM|nr:gag protease polyprotein [Cucumis melo var. makuwa]TYK04269.1 gag protease polyprotein [Cucumis melo var. makuwa]